MRTTPEGIQVIPVDFQKIFSLLDSEELRAIEEPIAKSQNLKIIYDKSAASINLIAAELSVCGMTTDQLFKYMQDNRDQIVRLALKINEDLKDTDEEEFPEGEEQDPSEITEVLGFASGFGLSHAIYHNFLSNRSGKELRAFLKNRRIPSHTKYAKAIEKVFASMNANN